LPRRPYYGFIGNGETAALISPDTAIEWLCVPRFDSFPFFAAALSPEKGGSLRLIVDPPPQPFKQRYLPYSNVLETIALGPGFSLKVLDFMPWRQPCLIRYVTLENRSALRLSLKLSWEAQPIKTSARSFSVQYMGPLKFISSPDGTLCIGGLNWPSTDFPLVLGPGERYNCRLLLSYGTNISQARHRWFAGWDNTLEKAVTWWRRWFVRARSPYLKDKEMLEAYYTSLMVLKLLIYEPTGAIVAAPTTSFPAVPGGNENWDYRYTWLRDGYLTALALDGAGYHREARDFYEFALSLQEPGGGWERPLYPVERVGAIERIVDDLAGPRGEKPIRFGNAAQDQLQLDNSGNILDGLWNHYLATRDRDYIRFRWPNIRRAALWIENHWYLPENGIWEIREITQHWVYGKILCYAGLRAVSHLAIDIGNLQWSSPWHECARRIRRQILIHGWSKKRQAFVQYYHPEAPLDISVLALVFYGLLYPQHPRMKKTVAAMEEPSPVAKGDPQGRGGLHMWGGVARYEQAQLPFYLATFWLARYYLHAGEYGKALELIKTALDSATDLYLMAEHFDPRSGQQWGNFPQGFSHEELVRLLLDPSWARLE